MDYLVYSNMIKFKPYGVVLEKVANEQTTVKIDDLRSNPAFTPEELFESISKYLASYPDILIPLVAVEVDDEGEGDSTLSFSIYAQARASDGTQFSASTGFMLFKIAGKSVMDLFEVSSLFEEVLIDLKYKVMLYKETGVHLDGDKKVPAESIALMKQIDIRRRRLKLKI